MTARTLIVSGLLLATLHNPEFTGNASAATVTVPGDQPTIAAALEVAVTGDRVVVAAGTYAESGLTLPSGVALVGATGDPSDVIIDGRGQGRILLLEGVDSSSRIAHLTFRGGRAAGRTSYERSGGAIYSSNSNVRIIDCVFVDNVSDGHGGAIRCTNGEPEFTGCVFRDNSAPAGGGGAIDCSFDASPVIRGCSFEGNEASWGGALSCRGFSSPTVEAGIFLGNAATGTKAYGGAVFADFGSAPSFTEVFVAGNTARYGGGFASLGAAATNLTRCTVVENTSELLGGGIFAYEGAPAITASIIAFQAGTGVSAEGGAAPLISCSNIFGNTAGDWVGAISAQLAVGDNLADDPRFCGTGDGAVAYVLEDGSPSSAAELACGVMGALPVGCGEMAPTVSGFTATAQERQVRFAWRIPYFAASVAFRLDGYLLDAPDATWDVPVESLGGGYFEAVDPDAGDAGEVGYRLYAADGEGGWDLVGETNPAVVPSFTGVRDLKAFPNPFNPMTTISFRLGADQRARIAVYTPDGRRVAVLADRVFDAGPQSLTWTGQDDHGQPLGSGLYIVLVEGRVDRVTRKVTLLK